MTDDHRDGLVIRVTGYEVWVESGAGVVACLLRGRFRKKDPKFQIVAGDRVTFAPPGPVAEHGAIESVYPRATFLSRFVGGRASGERVIIANLDMLIVVVTPSEPGLSLPFLDRILVSAERGNNDIVIVANKTDLAGDDGGLDEFFELYEGIGYRMFRASAKTGDGIDEVDALLAGGIYAFVGQSGVGKSSILNRIDPSLDLKTSYVANKTGRGRHTTTFSQLFPMKGGYVADTPGMQTFGFPGTDRIEIADCFPEFRPLSESCRFQPCTHSHEPGCEIKHKLEEGTIAQSRYRSYISMLDEVSKREQERY